MSAVEVLANPYYSTDTRLETPGTDELRQAYPDQSLEETAYGVLSRTSSAQRGAFLLELADIALDVPAVFERRVYSRDSGGKHVPGLEIIKAWPTREVAAFNAHRAMLVQGLISGTRPEFTAWRQDIEAQEGMMSTVGLAKALLLDGPIHARGRRLYQRGLRNIEEWRNIGYADSLRMRTGARKDSVVVWGAEGSSAGVFPIPKFYKHSDVQLQKTLALPPGKWLEDIYDEPFDGMMRPNYKPELAEHYFAGFSQFVNKALVQAYRLGQSRIEQ